MADLVEQLLARPGLYVGVQTRPGDTSNEPPGVARIEVMPLPGGSGVMLAYEVLAASGELVHHEHAVLARSSVGLVLVTSHTHADITTVISEDGAGHFRAAEGTAPFPMAIDLEVPDPGHLVYKWSYGWADEPIALRDVGDVQAVS
jgi:hypothetical protein